MTAPRLAHRVAIGWLVGVLGPLLGLAMADPGAWAATLGVSGVFAVGSALVAIQCWAIWSLYHVQPRPALAAVAVAQMLSLASEVGR